MDFTSCVTECTQKGPAGPKNCRVKPETSKPRHRQLVARQRRSCPPFGWNRFSRHPPRGFRLSFFFLELVEVLVAQAVLIAVISLFFIWQLRDDYRWLLDRRCFESAVESVWICTFCDVSKKVWRADLFNAFPARKPPFQTRHGHPEQQVDYHFTILVFV